jgi:outer membrane beta-barrel protein
MRMPPLLAAALVLSTTLVARSADAQHEEAVAPLLDQHWSRQLVVVQPRSVQKAHALEIVALAGVIPNDAFLVYIPLGVRAAFHIDERWAVEASLEINVWADTGLRSYLEQNDAQLRVRIRDRQQLRASASAMWSPAYGKLALGGGVLHFEGYLVGGAGLVRTAEEPTVGLGAAVRPDFHVGLGLRAFLGRRWLLRLEYRQYLFLRPTDSAGRGGGVGWPSEIALCGGVLLGGHR